MEIHLNPEKEARLSQIATQRGLNADDLVQQALNRYLDDDERFIAAVNTGLTAADRGDFVEHEEVWSNVEKILRP
jgi:predicted transcriptional regulator